MTKNKTFNYVLALLKLKDKDLFYALKYGFCDVCIHDYLYDDQPADNLLFIKMRVTHSQYYKVYSMFRESVAYHDEYVIDADHHMFVVKIKDGAITAFLEGRYGDIYTPDELNICINRYRNVGNVRKESAKYLILSRDKRYISTYLDKLNAHFKTSLKYNDIKDFLDYELPPKITEETFNHPETQVNEEFISHLNQEH